MIGAKAPVGLLAQLVELRSYSFITMLVRRRSWVQTPQGPLRIPLAQLDSASVFGNNLTWRPVNRRLEDCWEQGVVGSSPTGDDSVMVISESYAHGALVYSSLSSI